MLYYSLYLKIFKTLLLLRLLRRTAFPFWCGGAKQRSSEAAKQRSSEAEQINLFLLLLPDLPYSYSYSLKFGAWAC
jgi:hypothetical protein